MPTIAQLEREIERLKGENERLRGLVPIRQEASAPSSFRFVQVIGGNTLASGQDGINFASTVTPTAAYDPDVDTTYPDGLGRGWLYSNGRILRRVLLRHDYGAYTAPFLVGRRIKIGGTVSLTYSGTSFIAYTPDWE
jgi:hypothetical protein